MKQPRGIAVILGVLIALGVIAVAVTGVVLVQRKPAAETTTNANAALNLACTVDADCSSYCGTDSCYQPICGTSTIGGSGSCTCRSLCGPIGTTANTNTTTNTNVATNANGNTNTTPDPTAGWKTYTNTVEGYTIKYPANWSIANSSETVTMIPPDAEKNTSVELGPYLTIKSTTKISDVAPANASSKVIADYDCKQNRHTLLVNGISSTQQDESCFATIVTTYIPKGTKYIQVRWAEVFEDDYPQYSTILSTFTFTK